MALSQRQLDAGANLNQEEIEYWQHYGVEFNRIGHIKNSSKKEETASKEEHQNGDSVAINGCRAQVRTQIAAGKAKFGGKGYDEDFAAFKTNQKVEKKAADKQARLQEWWDEADPKILKKANEDMKKANTSLEELNKMKIDGKEKELEKKLKDLPAWLKQAVGLEE
eukprot:TRINITY_DN86269_c0_g1_i1.p1 TRINITY_DN86269_c0_g1~~TRINITY_DN86269_c0_g1_i1.p1  ORF type:complete len:166 (+),score=57.81 TRINITY_DN86269_c0_g1_i1:134-631(+)